MCCIHLALILHNAAYDFLSKKPAEILKLEGFFSLKDTNSEGEVVGEVLGKCITSINKDTYA